MLRCALLALLVATLGASASAQVPRLFPSHALRGDLVVTQPPDVRLNGKPARFAPGVRIRDESNRFVVWGTVAGAKAVVNYTLDGNGEMLDVWLLTVHERSNLPWPRTLAESQAWQFDPTAQTWSRR